MALSSTGSRISYAGNGTTTVFSFPYKFQADEDLVVIDREDSTEDETVKTITTHYTVTGATEEAGGSVTMLTAPATGHALTIYRDPEITQDLDLQDNDALPAEEVEDRLDKLTMISQRLSDRVDRSATLPEGLADSVDTTLPTPAAGYAIGWNPDGDGLINLPATAAEAVLTTSGSRGSPNSIAAGVAVVCGTSMRNLQFIQGSGGAVTMSANPQIADGTTVGKELILVGRSDTNTVTIANGNGMSLNGDITLGDDDVLSLVWDGTYWQEISRRR